MKNIALRNSAILALVFFICPSLYAATLVIFDVENFQIVKNGNEVFGYYVGGSTNSSVLQNDNTFNECVFYFKKSNNSNVYNLRITSSPRQKWSDYPYGEGILSIDNKTWRVGLNEAPRGCSSSTDQNKLIIKEYSLSEAAIAIPIEEQGFSVIYKKEINAIGIMYTKTEISIDANDLKNPSKLGTKIRAYSPLVAIKSNKKTTYVKYINPETLTSTFGWVPTSALSSPFPRH